MQQALIIGATSDIAIYIAKNLAKRGFNLYLTGRDQIKLTSLKDEIEKNFGRTVECFYFDITDFSSHTVFYSSLPIKPIMVFCCVGYYEDQVLARQKQSELLTTINVNYAGVLSILNVISNDFEIRGSGSITAISSVAGDRGRQLNYIYGSTKAGLTTYLSGLRNRLFKKNVHVTTIQLGPVYTKMSQGHKLIPWLTLQPEVAAKKIVDAGISGKGSVYIFWPWRFIMLAIRWIPEVIFKRLGAF